MKFLKWFFLPVLMVIFGNLASAMDIRVETGLVSNWWDSDTNDRGNQTYVPVTINAVQGDFGAKVLTALVATRIDPSDGTKNSMTTAVDTKLNLSYALVDRWPVDLLFGLDFNLPTGLTNLDREDRRMLLDPDLVSVSRYGEGFNVNPTITLAKDGDRWGAGIGIGYLLRGEYDFSDTTPDFDPGDIFNITTEILYAFSDRWQGRLLGEMAWYGIDSVEGRDYYQEGDFLLAGIGLNYVQAHWDAAFTLKGFYRGKCDFQADNQQLATEDRAGFGDEYLADLVVRVQLNPVTQLSSRLYYLAVLENDYPDDDPLFIDNKDKVSLRFSLERQLPNDFSGRIGIEGYRMDEGRNWYHDDDREYRGMIVDFSLTKVF